MIKKIIIISFVVVSIAIASIFFFIAKDQKLPQGIIILDLSGNGIELIDIKDSRAFFDIDNDKMMEKVSWVKPSDGILAIDKNQNKKIDNITELFGKSDIDQDCLNELFQGDENKDSKIDKSDNIFSQILIWRNYNEKGMSKPSELTSLEENDITAIKIKWVVNFDNLFSKDVIRRKVVFISKENDKENEIGIINLDVNQANSIQRNPDYKLNLDVISLPFSRGYGDVKAWPIAMSEDPDLLILMQDIVNLNNPNLQSDPENLNNNLVTLKNLNQKIEQFIYLWTGTENVTKMRGAFDGRRLAAMEKIRGESFKSANGGFDIAAGQQAELVQKAWEILVQSIKIKIFTQGTFRDIFEGAQYDFKKDRIDFRDLTADKLFTNLRNYFLAIQDQQEKDEFKRMMTDLIITMSKNASGEIYGLNQDNAENYLRDAFVQ